MNFVLKFFASGFGTGYSPVAPGTVGSALACVILFFLNQFFPNQFPGEGIDSLFFIILILVFFAIGVYAGNFLEPEWGEDPSKIVIDEMVGLWIAMLFIPFTIVNLAVAFVLFRFFDITKPLGIRKLENFKNGWGVMLDDVLAGVYANLVLQVIILIR